MGSGRAACMIYLEAAKRLQELTEIPYHKLTAVLFGNNVDWLAATTYILAAFYVPREQGLFVFRTECYTTNVNAGATDFMLRQTVPEGTARWATATTQTTVPGNLSDLTDPANVTSVVLDVDNWLLFGSDQYALLIGELDVVATTRQIRTNVYGFLIPGEIFETINNGFQQIYGFAV